MYQTLGSCKPDTTFSSTPDQQLKNHSTKYHRQQPLYNTLELLMMGIVVPETCSASNKICNKNLCCIQLTFYFHISKISPTHAEVSKGFLQLLVSLFLRAGKNSDSSVLRFPQKCMHVSKLLFLDINKTVMCQQKLLNFPISINFRFSPCIITVNHFYQPTKCT